MGATILATGSMATVSDISQADLIASIKNSPICAGVVKGTDLSDITSCLDPKQNRIQAINFEGTAPSVDFTGLTSEQVAKTIMILPNGLKVALSDIMANSK